MPRRPVRHRFHPKSYHKVKKKRALEENSLIFRAPSYHPFLEHSYGKEIGELRSLDAADEVAATKEPEHHTVELFTDETSAVQPHSDGNIFTQDPISELHAADEVTATKEPENHSVELVTDETLTTQPESDGNIFTQDLEDNSSTSTVIHPQEIDRNTDEAPEELAMASIEKLLPPKWHVVKVKDGMNISCGPDNLIQAGLSQRFISVTWEGSVVIYVHGKKLPSHHPAYSSACIGSITHDTVEVYVKQILEFITTFRQMEICCGIYQEKYKVWWKRSLDTCFIDSNNFCEARYSETLRRKDCEYLVDQQRKRQCANCLKTSAGFARRKIATCSPAPTIKTPNKFKPYSTLTSAEKDKREKRKAKTIRALQKQVSRLRAQVDSLILKEGVVIDSNLDDELGSTLESKLQELKRKEAEAKDENRDKFLQIFIEQQLAARNAKGNHGINWHPLMIRFALQVKLCSQSSLNSMRGFVRLPSDRLLWDYTHLYSEEPGVNYDFINEIANQVKDFPHKYQSYHVLTYDEISISENLVQKKGTGKIIGYQKLNEVQTELLSLKETLEAEATNVPVPGNPTLKAAKKILTFMVRGTASGIQSCVASYPVVSLVKEDLHQYVWEVTGALESSGVKVVAFVSDGSTVNRSFYEMQPPFTPTDGLTFDTPNPWDLERPIFFIPDPPHALKTARNCLENSGRKKSRNMKKNGEDLTWKPILRLFKWKSEQTIKKLPKLTAACVYLNSYSRMSVPYAACVMSNSVPSQIRLLGWQGTEELCIFIYI